MQTCVFELITVASQIKQTFHTLPISPSRTLSDWVSGWTATCRAVSRAIPPTSFTSASPRSCQHLPTTSFYNSTIMSMSCLVLHQHPASCTEALSGSIDHWSLPRCSSANDREWNLHELTIGGVQECTKSYGKSRYLHFQVSMPDNCYRNTRYALGLVPGRCIASPPVNSTAKCNLITRLNSRFQNTLFGRTE